MHYQNLFLLTTLGTFQASSGLFIWVCIHMGMHAQNTQQLKYIRINYFELADKKQKQAF